MPNSTDRVLQGAGTRGTVGTELSESLPNIKGNTGRFEVWRSPSEVNGAFTFTKGSNLNGAGSSASVAGSFGFDASRSSSTYQDDAPVQQDALCIAYIIKF